MTDSATVVSQFRPAPGELPPISVPPGMDPASVSKAKGLYAQAGYSPEQIAAASWPTAAADKTQAPVHGERDGVPISVEAQQRHYQNLYDNWTGDKQEVVRAAKAAGITLKGEDGQFIGAEGAIGRSYQLNYTNLPGMADEDPEILKAFDGTAQDAGRALTLSQHSLQQFVEAVIRTADAVPDVIDDQEMRTKMEVEGSIIRGLTNSKEIIELAALGDAELKKAAPEWYAAITSAYGLHSAAAQLALANIGREIKSRKK